MADEREPRCIVVGDVMMDITVRISTPISYGSDTPAEISIQRGGSAANTAAWMSADGRTVTFVGAIGADAFGQSAHEQLRAEGVDARLIVSSTRSTGTCVVIVDAARERTMFPDKGANDELAAEAVADLDPGPGDHVHLSGYVLLNPHAREAGVEILRRARAAGSTTSLDAASAGPLHQAREAVIDRLDLVDVLLANEDEAAVLTGEPDAAAALAALARLVPTAVVKRGARGVLARSGSQVVDDPALPAEVVDTTGAGDAFAAGFVAEWLATRSLVDAVRSGQRLAARAVSRVGATPGPH